MKEEATYRMDTGGTPPMGRCHHTSKFGFVAFPDSPSAGKTVYIVNENNTIFRRFVTGAVRKGTANPPGMNTLAPEFRNWPDEATLKKDWAKRD